MRQPPEPERAGVLRPAHPHSVCRTSRFPERQEYLSRAGRTADRAAAPPIPASSYRSARAKRKPEGCEFEDPRPRFPPGLCPPRPPECRPFPELPRQTPALGSAYLPQEPAELWQKPASRLELAWHGAAWEQGRLRRKRLRAHPPPSHPRPFQSHTRSPRKPPEPPSEPVPCWPTGAGQTQARNPRPRNWQCSPA